MWIYSQEQVTQWMDKDENEGQNQNYTGGYYTN